MFRDILQELDNIKSLSNSVMSIDFDMAVRSNARQRATNEILAHLITAAKDAIRSIPEFQYHPLEERLLQNLRDPAHIDISFDLGSVTVFNEELGGTIEDFESGLYKSTAPYEKRFHVWKYGMYMPGREGGRRGSRYKDYPTYREVIADRLTAWGEKAPYWRFLEFGNQGGAPGYPSFAGTGFISKTAADAPAIVQKAIMAEDAHFYYALGEAVELQITSPEIKHVVVLTQSAIPEGFTIEERWGARVGTYYQLRDAATGRMLGKIRPGEMIGTTGRRFNP